MIKLTLTELMCTARKGLSIEATKFAIMLDACLSVNE